ncbi:hypothetical protein CCR94_15235 [Rhodoblastus sphagnicola]|uniref:LTXXQ motif family protein n=1 Tax=Rhodoblastus sphagnicola TaxID=333368 RepID=A0A2S6N4D5_9HYPH|nr:Spy/CpxP family protein refolding chaperone [Rhodoblastus sphagnicola]MBB4200346.1 hypothetical protein [Rhodoblastus sphagnicola]PPQ29459.1 hypothetical protein CCR94_15235 [Rhodoblastus sphagnicola]
MRKLSIAALVLAIAAFTPALAPARAGTSEIERVCAPRPDQAEREARFTDRFAEHLRLSDAQKASYKAFQEARKKSVETATARLCAKKPDVTTFEGRLAFHQAFLEDRLDAVKAENPKLIDFYNSLDAEQKNKFDKFREGMTRRGGR